MILRRLELKPFGRFDACSFEFRRGLNLVVGPSESGKSTLAEAVPLVLFGARDRERYRPWGGRAEWAAAVTFEEGGRTLRIERDLLTDHVSLIETDAEGLSTRRFAGRAVPRELTAEDDAYRQELLRWFGLAEEELFRFGLLFEQGYVERLGAEGAAGAVPALPAKTAGDARPASPDGEGEMAAVRRRLAELERLWFDTRNALAEGRELSGKIPDLEALIAADRDEFAKAERYLGEARREAGGTAPAMELETRRRHLERELAKTGLPRQMPAALPAVLVQADELRQEMIAIQKEAADLRQQLLKRPAPSWRPAVSVTLLSVLLVAVLSWTHSPWLAAGLSAGVPAAVLGWASYLWRTGRERQERGRLQGPLQVLEERREEAQSRLAGLDEQFSRLGLSPSAVEIVRMQKNLERHLRLQQELAEVESAMGVPETPKPAGTEEASMAVAPEDPPCLGGEEFIKTEAHLAALGKSLKIRQGELQELYRQAADRERLQESLRRIEEEGEALRRREAELASRPTASPPVVAAVSSARIEPARLAGEVGQTLAAMTAGRYASVRLGEDGACSLRGEDGEWHPLEHFSRGTVESFCFALRLSLGRQLSGERRLPLILDGALAGFDPIRQSDSVKLLERLASEQQVILLSRDEDLRKRASRERWHTISLAAEKVQKPSRSQERSDDDGQLHLL